MTISRPIAFSEIGQKANQEDALYPHPERVTAEQPVLVLCDGMGGHAHGELASCCVADAVGRGVEGTGSVSVQQMKQRFSDALSEAYEALDRMADAAPEETKGEATMGTTLTFLARCTDGLLLAHIGDSRIYQFRPGCGVVFQTRDHSLVNELLAAGELTEEEALTFPQRNVITRAVQAHQTYPSKATTNVLTDVRPGDVFLLCCDGVVEQLDNADLERILLAPRPLDERLEALRQCCAERHTRDNHTCWLFEVKKVSGVHPVDRSAENDTTDMKDRMQPSRSASVPTSASVSASSEGGAHRPHVWLYVLCALLLAACLGAGYMLMHRKSAPVNGDSAPVQGTIHRPSHSSVSLRH